MGNLPSDSAYDLTEYLIEIFSEGLERSFLTRLKYRLNLSPDKLWVRLYAPDFDRVEDILTRQELLIVIEEINRYRTYRKRISIIDTYRKP